jgi:hypothetical protein
LFFWTAAAARIKVFGFYVKKGHLLTYPLDRIATFGVSQLFNLLLQCFALCEESAVSSVRHVSLVSSMIKKVYSASDGASCSGNEDTAIQQSRDASHQLYFGPRVLHSTLKTQTKLVNVDV